jgi:two-component system sensor histidine kinase KdpD
MITKRPDPDALLERVEKEEQDQRQGKLNIFFGAAPGVGKTYAMLEAARKKKQAGEDLVVGIVETHGRPETEKLLEGLESLPRIHYPYRGRDLPEFDLDLALERNPSVILVDELAHTNASGARHKKRWQDVHELLSAGISVLTTLNVQHLESLNDIVHQITGVNVLETIPDSFLDRADEIEIIDLPPDDLLQRLKEGKVYIPEQAEKAAAHFFRKGNLIALRELALRRTAQRVDAQMESYRRTMGVHTPWQATERILVCISSNPRAVRLIRAARLMAAGLRAEWIAVNVEAPSRIRASENDKRLLAEHMRMAESLGAETITLTGNQISEEILNFARSKTVSKIIVGKPTHPRWKDKIFGSYLDEIIRGSGDIDVYVIIGETEEPEQSKKKRSKKIWIKREEWIWSIGAIVIATGVAKLMFTFFGLINLVMVYLLAVVVVAVKTSRIPSLLSTFLSVAAFDFFFVPPYRTFAVAEMKYIVTFFVMFVVSIVISRLALKIREQAEATRRREQNTAALYALSRDLAREREKEKLSDITVGHIGEVFRSQAVVLIPDEQRRMKVLSTAQGTFALDQKELGIAQWVFDNRQTAGFGTDTLSAAKALYLPMIASSGCVGVIGVLPPNADEQFDVEAVHFLETFINQTAMALERMMLAQEAHRERMKAESQSLRNAFLSSISHDLRTPLATITGASGTLMENRGNIPRDKQEELIKVIHEEADNLNHIISNILNITRLESGAVKVNKQWYPLEEIIGAVLDRHAKRLHHYPVSLSIPSDLPMVPFDPILMEQVFTNLIENAVQHTPPGTPVDIEVRPQKASVRIEVSDRGPGIDEAEKAHIFDKFGQGRSSLKGIGLGLYICKAVVVAHGGRIWADNRPGGGAVIGFILPVEGAPPKIENEIEA